MMNFDEKFTERSLTIMDERSTLLQASKQASKQGITAPLYTVKHPHTFKTDRRTPPVSLRTGCAFLQISALHPACSQRRRTSVLLLIQDQHPLDIHITLRGESI